MSKIAKAYGIPYIRCESTEKLNSTIEKTLNSDSYMLCEIMVDTEQGFEPKSASKRLPDGKMVSAPLEDLKPFLDRKELEENMIIDLLKLSDNIVVNIFVVK